jgi:putative glutamine amidotransferase
VTGPEKRFPQAWWMTRLSLRLCGADAVYLTPERGDYHQLLSAVIIGGGDDIDPGLYGHQDVGLARIDRVRDAFEVNMIEHALRTNLPILGICRGMQLLNVVLGGTLYGDIRGMRFRTSNRRTPFPRKSARIDGDSELGRAMGFSNIRINSLHHQAVDTLGRTLRAVAWDGDEFIQAVEGDDHRLMLGVQWHPEYLPYLAGQRRLFCRLIKEARDHRQERLL